MRGAGYGLLAAVVAGTLASALPPPHVSYSTGRPNPLDARGATAPKRSKRRGRRLKAARPAPDAGKEPGR